MATINLFVDTSTKSLISGLNVSQAVDPLTLPLSYPDTPTLNVYLLQKLATQTPGVFPYSVINNAGLSFALELTDGKVDSDRTVYTSQITWTKDANNQYFIGTLPLNTAAVKTLVQASAPSKARAYIKACYFVGPQQNDILDANVNIGIGVGTTSVVVPPGQTALSAEVAAATFVPQTPVAGQPIQLMSQAGKIIALYVFDEADGTATFKASAIN